MDRCVVPTSSPRGRPRYVHGRPSQHACGINNLRISACVELLGNRRPRRGGRETRTASRACMLSSAKPRKKLDPINEPYATQNLRLHTVGRRVQFDSLQHFACRSCPRRSWAAYPASQRMILRPAPSTPLSRAFKSFARCITSRVGLDQPRLAALSATADCATAAWRR